MASETVNALLVIADIGGYTRFMNLHRTSLAHAQENTSRLLDAIIDAAPDLELSGLEGDAAFLYAVTPSADEITRSLAGLASAMHRAFHYEQQRLEVLRVCWCDGCKQTGKLTVKVVAHFGEAVVSTTRGRSTLAGVDVIVVHRMLKNSVPLSEYVLMTDAVLERAGAPLPELAAPIHEELEGLGSQRLHYVDMAKLAEPEEPPPSVSVFERAANHASLTARSLPYYVGLKRSEIEVAE
jgi:Protein of unknown function (DUF2652)